jgi:hypothetical protein
MSTLTSLLSRDGVVSLDAIEQALQRQVLEGGELDTALLELGTLPENLLGAYRAAGFQLLAASRAQLEHINKSLLERVPLELAREHRVLPIALAGDTLVLATDAPLPLTDVQRLSRELGARLQFRIATELRVQVALSEHYHVPIPSRLRLLHERLRDRDPGELREVQPWSTNLPARASTAATAAQERERPSSRRARGRTPSSPVRVVPVVTLGSGLRSTRPPRAEEPPETLPARPSRLSVPGSARTSKRSSDIPRGPLTREQAIALLSKAGDRDRVIEVFFSFARQYFECTALFAVRDERLLGLEGSGLPSVTDLRTVEVPLARSGSLQSTMLNRAPRVLNLRGSAADRPLVDAIDRAQAQPCAIIPVAIRQRLVSLLYGDRNGDPIALSDLSDLVAILPAVAGAFERIIHERKLQAVEASRRSKPPSSPGDDAPPEGTFRPSTVPPRSTAQGMAPQRMHSVAGVMSERSEPSAPADTEPSAPGPMDDPLQASASEPQDAFSVLGMRSDVPAPPRVPSEAKADPPTLPIHDELADHPTIRLPAVDLPPVDAVPAARPASTRSRKGVSYSQRDAASERVARRREDDTTRPERPSNRPSPRARASVPHDPASADPPSPRTLSHPSAGKGSYAMRDQDVELVTGPSGRTPASPQAVVPSQNARRSSFRAQRSDPRREAGRAPTEREIVSIPQAVRDSLRTPRKRSADSESGSIVVDLSPESERLVEELCSCGPDEERPIVSSLLRLGAAGLLAIQRRFPGPLWFDRHKPRQRMPLGRDVSALARALYAFEERAIPVLVELLIAPQVDVRLCATLLAADRVCPELLWPMYQRLFDTDGQVRLIAFEALLAYRNVTGFDELQKSLRQKAADEREAIADRVSALEAIGVLRDPGSVVLLAKLSGHSNRQLSVSAHRGLVAITAQDFGDSERKWKNWLEKNDDRHRAEWLIDGLMHADERLRNIAGIELQKLTQIYYGFVASASKRERERAQRRYREWWQIQGRAQFGA